MSIELVTTAAEALVQARSTGQPAAASELPIPDADAAYAIQKAVAERLGWYAGGAPRCWKSGGASRAATLTHAPLPPPGVWTDPADARDWPFRLRGIEAEIALRLGRDVDAARADRLDAAAAIDLVDAMCVSIEIVDSRWREGLEAPALAKLADLQSHGALVLGAWGPARSIDWAAQECRVEVGKQAPVLHRGSHALADPFFVLPAWLRHATRRHGVVSAGTVVTTGTWVGILHAAQGDRVRAEFPGIGHAQVQL